MKVTVYFEAKAGAHMVAQFDEEETYMACLPALEALATSKGYIVTESVDHAWTAEKFEPTVDYEDAKQIEIDNLRAELKYFYEGRT
jgi:hypothetical protein